jgi:hypothetical protein
MRARLQDKIIQGYAQKPSFEAKIAVIRRAHRKSYRHVLRAIPVYVLHAMRYASIE